MKGATYPRLDAFERVLITHSNEINPRSKDLFSSLSKYRASTDKSVSLLTLLITSQKHVTDSLSQNWYITSLVGMSQKCLSKLLRQA